MEDVKTPAASPEPVATPDAGTKPVENNVDYAAKLDEVLTVAEQLAKENEKLAEERDNYKGGMLSAKSKIKKLKEEGYAIEDDEDANKSNLNEERLSKIETMLTQIVAKKEADIESTTTKLNKTISELKVSLANRAPATSAPAGSGSNLDKPDATAPKWSPEQLAELKKRGLDPDDILKRSQTPQIAWSKGESN